MTHLVLLPGMDGTGLLFAPFLAALDAALDSAPPALKTTVIAYPTDQALDYAALESFVRARLPTQEPYVLLGESFSGPMAISLAVSGLPMLRGLVLCASFTRNPRPVFGPLRFLSGWLPVSVFAFRGVWRGLLGNFYTDALCDWLVGTVAQVSPEVLRSRLRAVLSVDVSAKLAQVHVPMLSLEASQDRLVPARAGEALHRLKPDMRRLKLSAPHFLLQTAPQAAARAIQDFLEALVQEAG
jgi:pimeloyl-ACP methyl ester carboxylesterase